MEGSQSESVDTDTLMALLKEKAKELKQTQKKLKKVEDKFVEMHKSQKNLISDRETFIQFLHVVFPQSLLNDEILIMPEGAEGYGMFDINHLRQFFTLTAQSKENEQLSLVQTMQDQKKILADKIGEYEERETQNHKQSMDIQNRLNELLEQNDELKERLSEQQNDSKAQVVREEVERKYADQLEQLERQLKEVESENSEIKAKQLMNAFQGQGGDDGN
jgi:predicted transcriptional regulator